MLARVVKESISPAAPALHRGAIRGSPSYRTHDICGGVAPESHRRFSATCGANITAFCGCCGYDRPCPVRGRLGPVSWRDTDATLIGHCIPPGVFGPRAWRPGALFVRHTGLGPAPRLPLLDLLIRLPAPCVTCITETARQADRFAVSDRCKLFLAEETCLTAPRVRTAGERGS